jgi:hypothetical protein
MKKRINVALMLGIGYASEAQFTGVNTTFDSHYYFTNNYERAEGGSGANGGSASYITDRFGAENSAFQNTKESGVVVGENANRAYTGQGFTFSAWIKPTNFTMNPGICTGVGNFYNTYDVRMIVEAANTTAPYDKDFRIFLKNGQLSLEFNTSDGLYTKTLENGNKPTLNEWQQIIVTTQAVVIPNVGLGKKITYYLNGVAQDSATSSSNFNFIFSGKAMEFGATNTMGIENCGNTFQSFQGGLDDFTFLSRGLNPEEVKELYNNERIHANSEISTLIDNHFAYYPLKFTPGNLDRLDIINRNTSISQLVPFTYEDQGIVANRNGVAVGALNQGGINSSASIKFNGHRIADGNKSIKPDSTMTVAFWVKNTGSTWDNTTFIDATNDQNANFKLHVNNTGNVVVTLGNIIHTFPSTSLPLNAWSHFAFSIDGKNKNLKLFINGRFAQVYNTSDKFKIPNNNEGSIFLMTTTMYFTPGFGNGWGGGGNGLVGHMNEIRFIKSALTENEILKLLSPTGKIKQKINIPLTLEYGQILQIPNASYSNLDSTIFTADGFILKNKITGTSTVTISLAETDTYSAYDTTLTITVVKKPVSVFIPFNSYRSVPYGSVAPTFSNVEDLIFNGMLKDDDKALITGTPIWSNLDKTEVGTYDIVYQSGFESPQYTFVDGGTVNEFTITKASLIPIAYDTIVEFGDTFDLVKFAPEIEGSLTYGINQDSFEPILEWLNNGRLLALRKGTFSVNASFIPTSNNYLPYNKNIVVTVNPAPITITVNNQSINYGFNIDTYYDPFNNYGAYTVSGLKNDQSLGGFYHNYITPEVITDYNPSTSPRGTYTLTIDTAKYKMDAEANAEIFYKITQINVGQLTLTGNKYQNIGGLTVCTSCGGGVKDDSEDEARLNKDGDGECVPTFRDRNPNESEFTINEPFSQDIMGENTNLPVLYEIISGPCTVSGNTFTLTGTEGTVTVHIFANGNEEYWNSDIDRVTYACFEVSNSVIINATEETYLYNQTNIYPNPATDFINVSDYSEIFDIQGNKVAEGMDKIDLSNLTTGMYVLRTNTSSIKIIKE